MPYALYARKSSDSEDRQVQSIDDQVRIGRELAHSRGLGPPRVLTEARSAKAPGRPVFAELIARIDAGEVTGIVCWNLNRLFRNSVDMAAIQYRLQTGALRAIVTPERTYEPQDNMLLFYVEAGMSNQYVLDLSKNVRRGMESKAEKGWFPHRAPEGYLNDPVERTIVPDGERFTLLRHAWELMLTGAYTVPEVKAELDRRGFRTKAGRLRRERGGQKRLGGGPISRTSLYDLFDNPFYRGDFLRAGKLYPGAHLPMVTAEEFERVQRILHKERHVQPKTKAFAFTGIITCGACGCLVTAEEKVKRYPTTGHEKAYRYYHCTGAKGCRKLSVTEDYVEETIRAALSEFRLDPQAGRWIREVLERHLAEEDESARAADRQREAALATVRRRLAQLVTLRLDGELDRAAFEAHKRRFEAEAATLERSDAGERAARQRQTVANAVQFCETAYDRFATGDDKAKRQVAQLLAQRYVLTLDTLAIEPHPLLPLVRALEPAVTGDQSTKKGPDAGLIPAWYRTADYIRTLVSGGMYFDPLMPMP